MAHRDEQHPQNPDGTFQKHCTICGTYVENTATEPAADFICEECEERDAEEYAADPDSFYDDDEPDAGSRDEEG